MNLEWREACVPGVVCGKGKALNAQNTEQVWGQGPQHSSGVCEQGIGLPLDVCVEHPL